MTEGEAGDDDGDFPEKLPSNLLGRGGDMLKWIWEYEYVKFRLGRGDALGPTWY